MTKRHNLFLCCLLVIFTLTTGIVFAQNANNDPAEGYWKSIDEKTGEITGVWKIYINTDKLLYGELVWIPNKDPRTLAEVCTQVSKYDEIPFSGNPAERTVLNTPWLYKLQFKSAGEWKQGHIIDPSDGNHYYCGVTYKDGKLVMRGSLDKRGWLGRSQTWESISQAEVEKLIAEANATYDIK